MLPPLFEHVDNPSWPNHIARRGSCIRFQPNTSKMAPVLAAAPAGAVALRAGAARFAGRGLSLRVAAPRSAALRVAALPVQSESLSPKLGKYTREPQAAQQRPINMQGIVVADRDNYRLCLGWECGSSDNGASVSGRTQWEAMEGRCCGGKDNKHSGTRSYFGVEDTMANFCSCIFSCCILMTLHCPFPSSSADKVKQPKVTAAPKKGEKREVAGEFSCRAPCSTSHASCIESRA